MEKAVSEIEKFIGVTNQTVRSVQDQVSEMMNQTKKFSI
jgi:hypothetical protein